MKTNKLVVLYSENFYELQSYFRTIKPLYSLEDIRGFNAIYRRIHPALNRDEKRRSEQFVDILIDNLERKEWAAKIFGVV